MTEKNQNILLAVALGAVLIYAYQKGFFASESAEQIAQEEANITDGSQSSTPDSVLLNMVKQFKDSLELNSYWSSDEIAIIYKKIDDLNETDLLRFSNLYSSRYPNDEYKTVSSALNSRWSFGDAYDLKYSILEKLSKIGAV